MNTVEELKSHLINQLALLESNGEFAPVSLRFWSAPKELKDIAVVQERAFSWGHCKSETCSHHSHDPYMEGVIITIQVKKLGDNLEKHSLYQLIDGRVLEYWVEGNGYHFAESYEWKIFNS